MELYERTSDSSRSVLVNGTVLPTQEVLLVDCFEIDSRRTGIEDCNFRASPWTISYLL